MPLQSTLITELYRESYNKSYFENEARPDVILKHNPDITKGILPLQDEVRRRMARNWFNSFGGPKRTRLPVLLESGVDIDILSEARKDMDFREMEKSLRERILACHGVPPALANLYEYANYANVKEQIRIFWRVTLPPKCTRITNTITRTILKPYDNDLWCRFDLSDISALEETVKEREERLSRMLERGGITLGQYRQFMGMRVDPSDPFKDKRVISANLLPLEDFFAGPPVGGEEPGTGKPVDSSGPGYPGESFPTQENFKPQGRGTHK
jgi:HK97 family phage portal protein